jgi:DNA-binding transcriptional ArsR family regulator
MKSAVDSPGAPHYFLKVIHFQEAAVDLIFSALASPVRRVLLDRLLDRDGQTQRELTAGLGLSRQAVTRHLRLLAEAGLVHADRHGRELRHFLDPGPIAEQAGGWAVRFARRGTRTAQSR